MQQGMYHNILQNITNNDKSVFLVCKTQWDFSNKHSNGVHPTSH